MTFGFRKGWWYLLCPRFDRPAACRLSPNWAAPIPLPGESGFLTLTEGRYVDNPHSSKTANSPYIEHWDANFHKVRYSKALDALLTLALTSVLCATQTVARFNTACITFDSFWLDLTSLDMAGHDPESSVA